MKKAILKPIVATGIYGVFMTVYFSSIQGFPGGVVPAIVASVIYISLMSLFLRREAT